MRIKILTIVLMLPLLIVSVVTTASAQKSLSRTFAKAASGSITRNVGRTVVTRPNNYARVLKPGTLRSIPTVKTGAAVSRGIPKPRPRVTAAKNVPKNTARGAKKKPVESSKFVKKSVAKKRLLAEAKAAKKAKNKPANFSRRKSSKKAGSEHTKNKRKSKREKHQNGRRRHDMDKNKKERGDRRRPYQR